MKRLKDLTKDELLSFIYNHPLGNVNVHDELADCCVCGTRADAMYYYECEKCQKDNEEWHENLKKEHYNAGV